MTKKVNYINRLLEVIDNKISDSDVKTVVWLGFYPGFPIIYQYLLEKGIEDIRIYDNDSGKWSWEIYPSKDVHRNGDVKVKIQPVRIEESQSTKYFVTNAHYKEFKEQFRRAGITDADIVDLRSMMDQWMIDDEKDIVSHYKEITAREIQLTELEILKSFRDFCDDRNLKYYLAAGTLLGAIRHKGFIPWDDDVDIYMPYCDYKVFVKEYPKSGRYYVSDWRNDPEYTFQFAKVVDSETYLVHWCPMGYVATGCYIDVFPLDGYPSDEAEIIEIFAENRRTDALWDYYMMQEDDALCPDDWKNKITNGKFQDCFWESKNVGGKIYINYNPWVVPTSVFYGDEKKEYEGEMFRIPMGYDIYLKKHYKGDYMVLPPKEKQVFHSFPTYIVNA